MGTFFFTDPETTETYTYWHTLSRRDALPIGREGGAADHQEARGVVAAVLDRAGDDLHSIDVRGVLAGDGRGVIGLLRPAHRLGVAGHGLAFGLRQVLAQPVPALRQRQAVRIDALDVLRSEEHTSELQSLMRISYAVFC